MSVHLIFLFVKRVLSKQPVYTVHLFVTILSVNNNISLAGSMPIVGTICRCYCGQIVARSNIATLNLPIYGSNVDCHPHLTHKCENRNVDCHPHLTQKSLPDLFFLQTYLSSLYIYLNIFVLSIPAITSTCQNSPGLPSHL